jgi:hypothetical protein
MWPKNARRQTFQSPGLDRPARLDILHVVTPLRRYVDGGPTTLRTSLEPEEEKKAPVACDACGENIEGSPAGAGLFLWTRGDEVRYEEPPLCERCAYAIAVGGTLQLASEDDEG